MRVSCDGNAACKNSSRACLNKARMSCSGRCSRKQEARVALLSETKQRTTRLTVYAVGPKMNWSNLICSSKSIETYIGNVGGRGCTVMIVAKSCGSSMDSRKKIREWLQKAGVWFLWLVASARRRQIVLSCLEAFSFLNNEGGVC